MLPIQAGVGGDLQNYYSKSVVQFRSISQTDHRYLTHQAQDLVILRLLTIYIENNINPENPFAFR